MRTLASLHAVEPVAPGPETALAAPLPETLLPLNEARRAFERDYLVRVLRMTRGNVTQAARLAGRNRTEFYRLLNRHALEPAAFKPDSHGRDLRQVSLERPAAAS